MRQGLVGLFVRGSKGAAFRGQQTPPGDYNSPPRRQQSLFPTSNTNHFLLEIGQKKAFFTLYSKLVLKECRGLLLPDVPKPLHLSLFVVLINTM